MLESTKSAFSTLSKGKQACAYVFIWKIFFPLSSVYTAPCKEKTISFETAVGMKDLNEL